MEERIIRINDDEMHGGTVEMVRTSLERLLSENRTEPITLFLNSYGGAAWVLEEIVALVKKSSAPINGIVGERAFSAAFNILQYCHRRIARINSLLLFHVPRANTMGALWGIEEGTLMDGPGFDEVLEQLSKRSGKDTAWLRFFAVEDRQLTAPEALELGFIDEIEAAS